MVEKVKAERLDRKIHRDSGTEEMMSDLLRALRRKKGFGLFFVQCNPAQAEKAIEAIRSRFSKKQVETFELSKQSETLYSELAERYRNETFDIACITGVEQALLDYEDTQSLAGWNRKEVYSYSWKGVPPLLSHLNRQREVFESNFPIALLFFVPGFVIDYFVQRAPDFFDWRSGFFKFSESFEDLQKASQDLIDKDSQHYLALTPQQRIERKLEIKGRVRDLQESDCEQASNLLREQGKLFEIEGEYIEALVCYDRALNLFSENYKVLNNKGLLLKRLERYKEAIAACEAAIEIESNYYQAWYGRGSILSVLSKHLEAVESYDRVIRIKPDYYLAWSARGRALENLKRYEEALENYDRAIEIRPDYHHTLNNRGGVLFALERYDEALEGYNRAIEIKPDYHYAWGNRGNTLNNLERYEEALESYNRAIEIKPDYHHAWDNRGNTLNNLERYEEALESCDCAIEIKPDYHYAWDKPW